MPDPKDYDSEGEWMKVCVPVRVDEGDEQDQAVAVCLSMWRNRDKKAYIKALGDWELEVLGNPFGSVDDKDSDGEFFSTRTKFHSDRFTSPLVHYYHGFSPEGQPDGDPEVIGEVKSIENRADGVWYRVLLDKASEYAKRVWEAAKQGFARASSGSLVHLVRTGEDGEILNFPVAELSLFDTAGGRQPANKYAVALPVVTKSYKTAGKQLPAMEDIIMPDNTNPEPKPEKIDISTAVQEAVANALKAEKEQELEAQKAAQELQDKIQEAVKSAKEDWDKEAAKSNRLPGGGAPYVTKYNDVKFDNLDPGEHAFLVGVQDQLQGFRRKGEVASDLAIKSLAMKMESEAEKGDEASRRGMKALIQSAGGQAIKSDEINRSTLASYGDEWIGVLYSNKLWEKIRASTWVLQMLEQFGDVGNIPDGYESEKIPLESTDPVWYKVAQAADTTSGRPDVMVTSSRIGTGQKEITVAKMGCRVLYTGEIVEDSLIRWVPNAYRQIQVSGSEQFEHALIDGDTAAGATTNINDIAGTPAGTEVYMLADGFRKLALVTNTANSRDGGALAVDDYLDTIKLMGVAGLNGADRTKTSFIIDPWTYWATLTLADVQTKDVFSQPTIEDGILTGLWGYKIKTSYFMHYAGSLLGTVTGSYQLKTNATGKIDQDTEANNTKGAILAVRWDQWAFRWKRKMTLETDRWIESDTNQIVAMSRWGMGYRDTEAAAISYNITV